MMLIKVAILVVNIALLSYFGWASLYFLFFALMGSSKRKEKEHMHLGKARVEILIPAYREDSVILQTARSAQSHQSVRARLGITVIADTLKKETIGELLKIGVKVLEVSFERSTKAKALNAALRDLEYTPDYILVLDADNVMKKGAIDRLLNKALRGAKIVQGQRIALNSNTPLSILDGISEGINNTIFRQGHVNAGLSSALIGSGFICDFELLRSLMQEVTAVGGFDKELEVLLLAQRIRINYAADAIIYDEKVQIAETFNNQRRRWISAQILYLRKNFIPALCKLFREGNVDLFDKILQFLIPPRIFSIGFPFAFMLMGILGSSFAPAFVYLSMAWGGVLGITLLALMVAMPLRYFTPDLFNALAYLPKGFFLMVKAMLLSGGANKQFIHTPHGTN